MNTLRYILVLVTIMSVFRHELYSQEADTTLVKRLGLYACISMSYGQSIITNEGIQSVSGIVSGKKNGISGSLDFGYFFNNFFGLSSGISYSSYQGQLTLATYENKFNTVDSENEPYERQVTGKNISEDQTISFIGIPVCMNLRIPAGKKFGFFLQAGIGGLFPITKKYTSNGTFTYKGYYPAYNVLLQDLPAYGFPSNAAVRSEGNLSLKPVCFDAIASAGFDIQIREKFRILLAATYHQTLSSISDYNAPENFQLSTDSNQVQSLMGGSSKTTIQSMGLKISLCYFLSTH